MARDADLFFEAATPLGFRVRVSKERWDLIIQNKHPVMSGREATVKAILEGPDEVRQSRSDSTVSSTALKERTDGSAPWPNGLMTTAF